MHARRTPRRRLELIRIGLARDTLAHLTLSIGCIARLCGYDSHRRFGEAFKRQAGVSPRRFRHGPAR